MARARRGLTGAGAGAGAAAAAALALLGGAGAARADYPANFCGGSPAPPWTQGFHATSGWASFDGGCTFDNGSDTIAFNAEPGAGFQMPTGLSITHLNLSFVAQGQSSGSDAFLTFGVTTDNGSAVDVPSEWKTSTISGAPQTLSEDVANGVQFWGNVFCSTDASTNCNFANPQIVSILGLGLTVHDATSPTVAATGGSLATSGTYAGTQPLIYRASSVGSGVAKVTVALGSTVVGTATSTCNLGPLQPCPPGPTGQFNVDTTQVPDGSYPVILTATDASGDSTPQQVSTVTVANHVAAPTTTTTTLRGLGHTGAVAPAGVRGSRRRRVDVRAKLLWHFVHRRTELRTIRFDRKLPRNTRVSLTCAGKGCPIRRVATGRRSLRLFLVALHGRQFRPGDTLILTFSRPHRLPERVQLTMRPHHTPRVRILAARVTRRRAHRSAGS